MSVEGRRIRGMAARVAGGWGRAGASAAGLAVLGCSAWELRRRRPSVAECAGASAGAGTVAAGAGPAVGAAPAAGHSAHAASSVVFLGTGTSSSNPSFNCVLGLTPYAPVGGCDVCRKASQGPPELNKDYRGNPSIAVLFRGHADGRTRFVQFDAGKTFLEAAKRWYPVHGITHLDAVVLTHEHADAVFGLDDLRLVQKPGTDLDIYLSLQTFEFLRSSLTYLTQAHPVPSFVGAGRRIAPARVAKHLEGAPNKPKTFVSSLRWHVHSEPDPAAALEPFEVQGMQVVPFPVWHGPGFLSMGYALGRGRSKFVYISDLSAVPEPVMARLKEWDVEYLVIDTLHPDIAYPSHVSLEQALPIIRAIGARKTLLVGVSHKFDHDASNAKLAELKHTMGIDVQVAYDGMRIELEGIDL